MTSAFWKPYKWYSVYTTTSRIKEMINQKFTLAMLKCSNSYRQSRLLIGLGLTVVFGVVPKRLL